MSFSEVHADILKDIREKNFSSLDDNLNCLPLDKLDASSVDFLLHTFLMEVLKNFTSEDLIQEELIRAIFGKFQNTNEVEENFPLFTSMFLHRKFSNKLLTTLIEIYDDTTALDHLNTLVEFDAADISKNRYLLNNNPDISDEDIIKITEDQVPFAVDRVLTLYKSYKLKDLKKAFDKAEDLKVRQVIFEYIKKKSPLASIPKYILPYPGPINRKLIPMEYNADILEIIKKKCLQHSIFIDTLFPETDDDSPEGVQKALDLRIGIFLPLLPNLILERTPDEVELCRRYGPNCTFLEGSEKPDAPHDRSGHEKKEISENASLCEKYGHRMLYCTEKCSGLDDDDEEEDIIQEKKEDLPQDFLNFLVNSLNKVSSKNPKPAELTEPSESKNPPESSEHKKSFPTRDWFDKNCEFCGLEIVGREYAVRQLLLSGAWRGCYHSFSCIRRHLKELREERDAVLREAYELKKAAEGASNNKTNKDPLDDEDIEEEMADMRHKDLLDDILINLAESLINELGIYGPEEKKEEK